MFPCLTNASVPHQRIMHMSSRAGHCPSTITCIQKSDYICRVFRRLVCVTILRTVNLESVHSIIRCCTLVWCRSVHSRFVHKLLHDTFPCLLNASVPHQRTIYTSFHVYNLRPSSKKSSCFYPIVRRNLSTCSAKRSCLYFLLDNGN